MEQILAIDLIFPVTKKVSLLMFYWNVLKLAVGRREGMSSALGVILAEEQMYARRLCSKQWVVGKFSQKKSRSCCQSILLNI